MLQRGMPKIDKDKLCKKYLIPENCKLLQAPKLNLEISAAITERIRGRDKKMLATQQQLGVGVTALNRALDVLVARDENHVIKAIKYLSDASRLLCDLHFMGTQHRIKLITPYLGKSFLNVIHDTNRDETLFGSDLVQKIKKSKAMTATATSGASTSSSAQSRGIWLPSPR